MLDITDINTYYGDAHILHDLSLSVEEGEIVALIGRNGAGKTTTMRSIMGLTPPRTGSIEFKGQDITGDDPENIYRKGIGFVPETRNVFPDLTVLENLKVGMSGNADSEERLEWVYDVFPRLEERPKQAGKTLSGGEQQMLAIARVLVSSPDLLLIDEPTEGLMPTLVTTIGEIIEKLNEEGQTIVLVEQNIDMALELSDRAYILSKGEIKHTGPSDEIAKDLDDYSEYLVL